MSNFEEYMILFIILHIAFGFLHYVLVCAWDGVTLASHPIRGRLFTFALSFFGIISTFAILSIIYEDKGDKTLWETIKNNGFKL